MRLTATDWIHEARRLPVGGRRRIRHAFEHRENMVVGNAEAYYWAYCHACHEGDRVMKDHVLVLGDREPTESRSLELPSDMLSMDKCDHFAQSVVASFLAEKNMDSMYLPPLFYSAERKRLLVHADKSGWLGRDLTGRSLSKWILYTPHVQCLVGNFEPHMVLVEDAFSYYKVRFALAGDKRFDRVGVLCVLGTQLRASVLLSLTKLSRSVHTFLDGDGAGHEAATTFSGRLRLHGLKVHAETAPAGMDPKDMSIQEIREAVHNGIR